MSLEKAYAILESIIPKGAIESFDILKQVQEYWEIWRPNHVNVLLLAESHVYTTQAEFEAKYSKIKLYAFIKN
jgi:hypothetical protein